MFLMVTHILCPPEHPLIFALSLAAGAGSIGQILRSDLALKDFKSLTLSFSLYVRILPGKQGSCPAESTESNCNKNDSTKHSNYSPWAQSRSSTSN